MDKLANAGKMEDLMILQDFRYLDLILRILLCSSSLTVSLKTTNKALNRFGECFVVYEYNGNNNCETVCLKVVCISAIWS